MLDGRSVQVGDASLGKSDCRIVRPSMHEQKCVDGHRIPLVPYEGFLFISPPEEH
jgi:hypothetical protein